MSRGPAHILIVEDEITIAMDIEMRLQKLDYIVDGIAADAAEGEQMAEKFSPDLVLMDIQLGDKMDGLKLARQLKAKGFPIVFLTAFGDAGTFAQALDLEPDGYVLKPFRDDDLKRVIEIALKKSREAEPAFSAPRPDVYFVREKGQLIRVRLEEICWIEAMDNYTRIHTDEKSYTIKAFLKDIYEKVPAEEFARIHRSFIIPVNRITKLEEDTVYIGKQALPVGKHYKSELLQRLNIL